MESKRVTRYQVLRRLKCDPLTAGLIAGLNWAFDAPSGEIHFMGVIIEFDPEES